MRFGWKLNQIVCAQIIVVPSFQQDATTRRTLTSIAATFGGIFALLPLVSLLIPRHAG